MGQGKKSYSKFTPAEYILGSLFFLIMVDGLCFLIDWTGVGLAIAPVIQAAATFGIEWVVRRKGGDTKAALGTIGKRIFKYLAGIIPLIPTTLIIFLRTAYLHNNPIIKKAIAIGKTGDIAATGKQMGIPAPIK